MALEPETKAELSKAGARFVSATGGVSPIDKSPLPGPAGNGQQAAKPASLTLMDRINEMATRDQEDWRYLSETLRKFVAQRRADLDYLERLLGTK